MNEEFEKVMKQYEETFDDMFPTFQMKSRSPEEMIKIMKECISKNKDVYDLGYLKLDMDYLY